MTIKHIAMMGTTLVVKAKLHNILSSFAKHDLSRFEDREEIAQAILATLGGAIEGTVGLFKMPKDDDENPFF